VKTITSQTPKFRRAVRTLRAILPQDWMARIDPETIAYGLLERMWHATAASAPRGDIGRMSDDLIAEAVGWFDDPQVIVGWFIDNRWIDRHPVHRLVVHGWAEHAPNHVKANVSRHHGGFVDGAGRFAGSSDSDATAEPDTVPVTQADAGPTATPGERTDRSAGEPPLGASYSGAGEPPIGTVPPNHSKPNQSSPVQTSPVQTGRRCASDSRDILPAGACEPDTDRTGSAEPDRDNSRDTVAGAGHPASNRTPNATPNATTAPARMPTASHTPAAGERSVDPATLDRARIIRACKSLQTAFADCNIAIDRNFVWRVCWTAAAITKIRGEDMGLVRDWIAGIRSGTIKRPQIYIETGLAKQASVIGLDHFRWSQTIPKIPDSVQPVG
jgi:hypothetical protein